MTTRSTLQLGRRDLLAALGLGGGAYLLPSLFGRDGAAAAQAMTPPRRLLVYWTNHGPHRAAWRMSRPGLVDDQNWRVEDWERLGGNLPARDWEFSLDLPDPMSFSEILRPLHAHRRRMLVLDGLYNPAGAADLGPGNEHPKAQKTGLTGTRTTNAQTDTYGPSIDQVVASMVRRSDRLASLEMGVGFEPEDMMRLSWSAPGVSVPALVSPTAVFDRLFPSSTPTTQLTDADRVRAEQASVLAFVANRYASVAPRLSGEDRRKLEIHRDLVRDLEVRVRAAASAPVCTRPERATQFGGYRTTAGYNLRFDAQSHLAATALACDLTRVVTLQAIVPTNEMLGVPAGADLHAEYIHNVDSPAGIAVNTRIYVEYARRLAALLDLLAAVPEGNGTVLDHTLVLWVTEHADGAHNFNNAPVVMFGNVDGRLRTGRYVRYGRNIGQPSIYTDYSMLPPWGPPINHLHATLCGLYGAPRASFGSTAIPRDQSGQSYAIGGTLPRLT